MKWKILGLAALATAAVLAKAKLKNEYYSSDELAASEGGRVNRSKARISRKGFQFEPFSVKGTGLQLSDSSLADDEELMLVERGGQKILLRLNEMAYHHVAQGELGGESFAVSF